ncbi:SCO family protein [Methylobacillus arboreus]|uniref:SCO family protein n=1 Tax=Methylobacillus arboreus TaxID=755170 RepID=UPI002E20B7A3
MTGAEITGAFTLTDHEGRQRQLEDFKGKVVAVFFGYTRCPDVCPTTMLSMANAMVLMGDKAQDVQVLFITVDPERDTQDILAQYVPSFYPGFIGLYGAAEQLKQAARNYKVVYAKQQTQDGSSYTVDHSAGVYVFDREGKIRAYLRHDETPEQLAHDITQFF